MNFQVTITPAKTRLVEEETPEIIMVPMTRREAECVQGLLGQCSPEGESAQLFDRLESVGVKQALVLDHEDIRPIVFKEGTL